MLSKISHKVYLISLVLSISAIGYTQSGFQKDSTQIVNNANELLASSINIQEQDSLIQFLRKETLHPSAETKDLVQFYLARHYYLKQDIDQALNIVYNSIIDNYNHNYSDAKFYNMQGAIHSLKREYVKAIKAFLKAAQGYQKQENLLREHIVYNNIANIYLAIGDHQQAYHYSNLCYSELKKHTDSPHFLSILGILVVCENNLDKLDSAKQHLDLGLKILDTTTDVQGEVILNFGKSEWEFKNNNYYKAIPYALKSKDISEKYGMIQYKIMNLILLMEIHNSLGESKLAIDFGLSAQENIKYYNNLSMEHSITNGLAIAYAEVGNYKDAYFYKKRTDSLKTLDRNEENKRTMDRLMVQFESLSNRNKILRQETLIAIQNTDLERRKNFLILGGFSLFFLILIIVGIIIFNRQRLKLIKHRQEQKIAKAVSNSEEAERSRISSELHDGLAADLTALKLELEQTTATEKALMILRNAHQITRRISHNLSPFMISEKGLVEAIKHLIKINNASDNLKFYTNITSPIKLDQNIKIILFRSTQELLQNALKHANASEIVVQVILNANALSISVEDNGIGIEKGVVDNSISLGSLRKRIELIHGELNIDSSPEHGTTVFINLKLKE